MRSPTRVRCVAIRVNFHELHPPRDDTRRISPFFHHVIDDEHYFRSDTHVGGIDQDRALLELVSMVLQHEIGDGLHQGMARMDETCHRCADTIRQADVLLLEADTLVTTQDWVRISAFSGHVLTIPFANSRRHIRDLIATVLARAVHRQAVETLD